MNERIRAAIEELQLRKKDMESYAAIMAAVGNVDVASNMDFQKKFTYFFRVRRDEAWRREFYTLFEKCKEMPGLSFEYILREMFRRTGKIEASFSSKMLAVINPQMPIWDSVVLSKLRMKPSTCQDKEKRIEETAEIYHEIDYWYKGVLQSDGAGEFLDVFDEVFPEFRSISSVKKVDFLLWGSVDSNFLPQKVFEINGCVEVPATVSEDEFMDKFIAFIEANHWYFGGGVNDIDVGV